MWHFARYCQPIWKCVYCFVSPVWHFSQGWKFSEKFTTSYSLAWMAEKHFVDSNNLQHFSENCLPAKRKSSNSELEVEVDQPWQHWPKAAGRAPILYVFCHVHLQVACSRGTILSLVTFARLFSPQLICCNFLLEARGGRLWRHWPSSAPIAPKCDHHGHRLHLLLQMWQQSELLHIK